MKVTVGQLRKIIKEETARALLESTAQVGDIVDYDWFGEKKPGRVDKVEDIDGTTRYTIFDVKRHSVYRTPNEIEKSSMSPEEFEERVESGMPSAADTAVASHERDWEERRRTMGR